MDSFWSLHKCIIYWICKSVACTFSKVTSKLRETFNTFSYYTMVSKVRYNRFQTPLHRSIDAASIVDQFPGLWRATEKKMDVFFEKSKKILAVRWHCDTCEIKIEYLKYSKKFPQEQRSFQNTKHTHSNTQNDVCYVFYKFNGVPQRCKWSAEFVGRRWS